VDKINQQNQTLSHVGKMCTQNFLVGIRKRRGPLGRRIILIWTYKQQEGRGIEGTHLTEDNDNYYALVSTLLRAATKVFLHVQQDTEQLIPHVKFLNLTFMTLNVLCLRGQPTSHTVVMYLRILKLQFP
jgi:hypothetical protein